MKKLTSAFAILGLTTVAASAAPSYIQRDGRYGYNVTYDYLDKAKTGWYMTARAQLSFLSWENKYSSDYEGVDDEFSSDKYSFEPVFGGGVSVGYKIKHFWRVEAEAGFAGMFQDKDNGFEFKMSVPWLMVNGYRDFSNGLYVGLGAGASVVTTKLDGDIFVSGDRRKTSVSPMGAAMVGWSHRLDDSFVLDLRYRFAGFNGGKQTRTFELIDDTSRSIEIKTGFVMYNSVSVGLRYEF